MTLPSRSIDATSFWLHIKNYAGLAWRQRRAHVANLLILLATVSLFVLLALKSSAWANLFERLKAPEWLVSHAALIGALWILAVIYMLHTRIRAAQLALAQDWLAALPIAKQTRWQFVCEKYSSICIVELLPAVLLTLWLVKPAPAIALLLTGALGVAVILIHAQYANETQPVSSTQANASRFHANMSTLDPMQAWFFGLIPTQAQLRWFWLLPMLLLPGAASLQMIGAALLGFAAFVRISSISNAIARGNCQMTLLLETSPLPAPKLYQASWRFAAQAILPLLIIAGLSALVMPLKLALPAAMLIITLGALATLSQLHFSFAFRYLHFPQPSNHSEASAKTRAWLIFLILAALLIRELAPLLPIFCVLSWRWLYRRGLAILTVEPMQQIKSHV